MPTDSAGQAWGGRVLPAGSFAGDDGRPEPALAEALARWSAAEGPEADIVAAVVAARLFVAVVAESGPETAMALMTITGLDGRVALPAFTSVPALADWRREARPVPVSGRDAAAAAVTDNCDLIALDPAGPHPYVVRRPALWCLAAGEPWQPAYDDPLVARAVALACAPDGLLHRVEPGVETEVRVVLGLPPGHAAADVEAIVTRVLERLSRDTVIAERVDSLGVQVLPA